MATFSARKTSNKDIELPLREATLWPVEALVLDYNNPRLQTGDDIEVNSEQEVLEALVDIAALDELVLSICTNKYLNLEPLIVIGASTGPFKVLEGNRRLASIRLIKNPALAAQLGITIPPCTQAVLESIENILVYRVFSENEAREFIGFKHINGPQRWDAYAKAKYVTEWYKSSNGKLSVDDIAAKMGDNNNTLRSYIYAILLLEQAEKAGVWSINDRPPARGRFPFSHIYTAIQRTEYQQLLGLNGWQNKPPLEIIRKKDLPVLGEILTYIYGSVSDSKISLIKSQNPDLKNLGIAMIGERSRIALRNGASLEKARDEQKEPTTAFHDALVLVNLRMERAINLLGKYMGGNNDIDLLILEIYEQADTLRTMSVRKKTRVKG